MIDHPFLDSFGLDPETKADHYEQLLRNLPAGLTEWAVHPAAHDPGMATAEAPGWRVRTSDHEFLTSSRARQIIEEEDIKLIGYDTLQPAWRASSPQFSSR